MKVTMEISYDVEITRDGETQQGRADVEEAIGDLVEDFMNAVKRNVARSASVRAIRITDQ